jgi:multimeric flavodoxin WrbA
VITVNIKVLGISGTPIKGGNCDTMVQEALKSAAQVPGVETEFLTLADKKIALCQHCQWCIQNRAPCKIQDDAHAVFDKMIKSDGLILGAPVWNVGAAPLFAILISRWRYHQFFTYNFRNKVSGLLTVGFLGMGMERALEDLEVVGRGAGFVVARGWAVASTAAFGQRPAYLEHGVLDDKECVSESGGNRKNDQVRHRCKGYFAGGLQDDFQRGASEGWREEGLH